MEHGNYTVTVNQSIIHLTISGAFNETGCLRFIEAMKSTITSFGSAEFAILFDITELEGGTPEAYQVLNEYNTWLNQQAMIAKAMVIHSRVQISIVNTLSPARKQQNIHSFFDRADAEVWLHQQLEQAAVKA